jgi:transposase InsO family protein
VRDLALLFLHLLATVARLAGPGGTRSVVAESVLVKQQLLILNRSRKRSPNLRPSDRVVAGLCALFMRPGRLIRSAIVVKPSTLLSLHRALIQRKYRRLFSSKGPTKPGPKGPSQDVIAAVVDMKQRNPIWGCPRIAQQITLAFGIPINKDVVRRILAARYQPKPDSAGPSWLTVRGHAKDSLWSLDLFRCESAVLHTHWVLVVMDQCTRRIVGFGVHRGVVDGVTLCQMFNRAIGRQPAPTYLSSDHDPLYRFHQWQANLRILDVEAIKTVPYVPLSHPFVERLIGTIRRECLDRTLFWTAADLELKLLEFQGYFNGHRAHAGLGGLTPEPSAGGPTSMSHLWGDGNRFDLELVLRTGELLDLDERARWMVGAKELRADGGDLLSAELADARRVDRDLRHMADVEPLRLQRHLEILEHLFGLLLHTRPDDCAVGRRAHLPGNEQELAGFDDVAVGLRRTEPLRVDALQLLPHGACGRGADDNHRNRNHNGSSHDASPD